MTIQDQVVQIYAATNGYLDRIVVDKVPRFLEDLTSQVHAEHGDLLGKIGEGEWSDEIVKQVDDAVSSFADDFGYDLDEEGQPLDEDRDEEREAA